MTRSIEVDDLSKQYRIGKHPHEMSFREQIVGFAKRPFNFGGDQDDDELIWALRNVSFHAEEGEVVGIVGRNGAGKSTLLKILSRITYPTSGNVRVRGRVASLLEVGTGFHDELTGRENIYLNGSILGMRRREVDRHFDAIVDFSGVEQFIDTPIKRYSSGMRMRLGFAVAAHLNPDVLIVDEVLAVGDLGFQKKCIAAMEGLRCSGRTVLFVSHNLAAVENLCSRGIWLDGGKMKMEGETKAVIEAYMGTFAGRETNRSDLSAQEGRVGSGDIRYTHMEYLQLDGAPCAMIRSGCDFVIRFHYRAEKTVRHPSFGFRLYTGMGTLITETGNKLEGVDVAEVRPGEGCIDVEIRSLSLLPAQYVLSLWITDKELTYDGDVRIMLDVEPGNIYRSGKMPESKWGIVHFPQRWSVPQTLSPPMSSVKEGLT